MEAPNKILIIQTAFIGDVILATALIEQLHLEHPSATLHFLLRKGNEAILKDHPFISKVFIWNKKKKLSDLFRLLIEIRKERYDLVLNVQRFFATGFLTVFSGAKKKHGFKKNPWSFLFDLAAPHEIDGRHEVARNYGLLKNVCTKDSVGPALYPSTIISSNALSLVSKPYITLSPASVWFTKQWPEAHWVALISLIPSSLKVYLLGGPSDVNYLEEIKIKSKRENIENLAGKSSLLESGYLMQKAQMNIVNDSGPGHLAAAVGAYVTTIFCSTDPAFGFSPYGDRVAIAEATPKPNCRPCGLHGKKECPLGHFKCGNDLLPHQVWSTSQRLNGHLNSYS
jgi:lipopolysaccharide heptosyltransferase II